MFKLLIVDDEAEIRNGYARFFPWEDIGYTVAGTAADGQRALAFLTENEADVVLCDLVMPQMDGADFVRALNQRYPQIPVIILSGYSSFEYARQLIGLSVFAYVLKSDKHTVLIDALKNCAVQLAQKRLAQGGWLEVVYRYVAQDLAQANLNGAAQAAHMSPNYLSRVFKERTGTNFYAYVLDQKMARACAQLKQTPMRIYQIAESLGYTNVKNFNRIFKQRMGLSPKAYRQRAHALTELRQEERP